MLMADTVKEALFVQTSKKSTMALSELAFRLLDKDYGKCISGWPHGGG
jgi:hypothetical protein